MKTETTFVLQTQREIKNDISENSTLIVPDYTDGLVKIFDNNKDNVRIILAEFDPNEALLVAIALKETAEEMLKNN